MLKYLPMISVIDFTIMCRYFVQHVQAYVGFTYIVVLGRGEVEYTCTVCKYSVDCYDCADHFVLPPGYTRASQPELLPQNWSAQHSLKYRETHNYNLETENQRQPPTPWKN